MTENELRINGKSFDETISQLEEFMESDDVHGELFTVLRSARDFMENLNEEIQQYRAIGTIEEFKRAKEMEAVYGQVKWERDIAISQLEEIGVALGQKMDEFKALKEKSVAKEPDFTEDKQFALCPNISCNSKGLKDKQQYCDCCGQKLDWQ